MPCCSPKMAVDGKSATSSKVFKVLAVFAIEKVYYADELCRKFHIQTCHIEGLGH